MAQGLMQVDYQHDFLINAHGQEITALSEEARKVMQASNQRDQALLANTFPSALQQLRTWREDNTNGKHTKLLQHVSLRYLRNYLLLKEPTQTSRTQVKELLTILITAEAIDLDVLTDAYIYSRPLLSSGTRETFEEYISVLHAHDIEQIRTRTPGLIEAYENSTGIEKQKHLLWLKGLERQSHACRHAREQLPELLHLD